MQNVVLLHGALGNCQDLEPLRATLKNRNINVHLFSFSGHGKINFQKHFDIDQFTSELEDFILKNSLQPANVFGYSMGGYVALNLASKQSDTLQKIITLGTKFDWNEFSVEKEIKLLNPEIIQEKVPSYAALLKEKHGENWRELLQKTGEMMKNIVSKQYLNPTSLTKIRVPVLLGIADRDQMVGLEETLNIFKTLPNANMFMLPSTKHQLETANLAILSSVIDEFLRI